MQAGNRPNVLLVLTDQQSASAVGCAGNRFVTTPAMDSIAAAGTRFDNACCTNPVCIPSRVSMFTGRYPHEAGIYSNTRKADVLATDAFTWLGWLLARAGYRTAYFGKWHLVLDHASEAVREKTGFHEGFMMQADRLLADAWADFLDEWTAGGRERPFFTVLSFVNPHNICEFARREPLPEGDIGEPPAPDLCPPLPENFEVPAMEPDVIRAVQREHGNKLYPTAGWDEGDWRRYIWAHDRMVELVDAELGKILASLEASGAAGNTVVIFTSDHGDGRAEHRWNQKQVLYESVVRVPLFVRDGWLPPSERGKVSRAPVSGGIDVHATICDYAGVELPPGSRGTSLRGLVDGTLDDLDRAAVFAETEFGEFTPEAGDHHGRPNGRMVRTRDFKYIVYSRGTIREQLFDMRADALEMCNLALDPGHESVLRKHRALLAAWCRETGDDFAWIT